jgi:hypothetical protein
MLDENNEIAFLFGALVYRDPSHAIGQIESKKFRYYLYLDAHSQPAIVATEFDGVKFLRVI